MKASLTLLVAACGLGMATSAAWAEDPIRIGVIAETSAISGVSVPNGAKLAAERIGEFLHQDLQAAQQRMAGLERRFDEVEGERQLNDEFAHPAHASKVDIEHRQYAHHGAENEGDQRIVQEEFGEGDSGAEHHQDD